MCKISCHVILPEGIEITCTRVNTYTRMTSPTGETEDWGWDLHPGIEIINTVYLFVDLNIARDASRVA